MRVVAMVTVTTEEHEVVGIESTNPLDHMSSSETIQQEFNNAYQNVILDEYCSDYVNDEED